MMIELTFEDRQVFKKTGMSYQAFESYHAADSMSFHAISLANSLVRMKLRPEKTAADFYTRCINSVMESDTGLLTHMQY